MTNELPPTHTFATLQSKRIGTRADYSSVSIHAKRVSDGKRVFFSVTTLDDGISFVDGCFKHLLPYELTKVHVKSTEAVFQMGEEEGDFSFQRLAFQRSPNGALHIKLNRANAQTWERLISNTPPQVMDRLEAVVNVAQLRALIKKRGRK